MGKSPPSSGRLTRAVGGFGISLGSCSPSCNGGAGGERGLPCLLRSVALSVLLLPREQTKQTNQRNYSTARPFQTLVPNMARPQHGSIRYHGMLYRCFRVALRA